MPTVEIRQLEGAERTDAWLPLGAYAFEPTPPLPDRQDWERWVQSERDPLHLVLFQDGKPVASAARSTMAQNVRGAEFPCGGVWGVAVHPSARRTGYARRLMSELLTAMREEGSALTTLYPFRESFYARLGYTIFAQPRVISFAPQALQPLLRMELDGAVELLLMSDGVEPYLDYLERFQRSHHGFGLFDREQTAGRLRESKRSWLALARVGGQVAGVMTYELKGDPRRMFARNFYYDDFRGRYLLLDWFARHIDQVSEVELKLLPGELPETWLPDLAPQYRPGFAPMGRVLDVARLGGMEVGPGEFTARIRDEQCAWNEGVYRFRSVDGRLQVTSGAPGDAAFELTISGLSALIYGTHEPETFALRGWGAPTAALQATLRTIFPPRLPYLHETF